MISQRTKAALAAAKARGVRLGNPMGARAFEGSERRAAEASAAARRAGAAARAQALGPVLRSLAEEGVSGAPAVARELNRRGIPAPSGGVWYPGQVRRCGRRLLWCVISGDTLTRLAIG
jgi:hypothetical protein